jgi:hypothetical protein
MRLYEFVNIFDDDEVPADQASPMAMPKAAPTRAPVRTPVQPKPKPKPMAPQAEPAGLNRDGIIAALAAAGYEDVAPKGNTIRVLVQIPDGAKKNEFRQMIAKDIVAQLQRQMPEAGPTLSGPTQALGSLGGIVFPGTPYGVTIKDQGKQGASSAGMDNEIELAGMLASMVEKYKSINVTFIDERGKKLTMNKVTSVEPTGKDVAARKKADIVLSNKSGKLPISIKQLDAETWESADRFFGAKARQIIDDLVAKKVLKLIPLDAPPGAFALSKEVVIEPTEEEAMMAIFGSDINPAGGIVIQTFEPQHFKQNGASVTIDCHAVIKNKEDIPESHMMVWLLRNNASRLSKSLGIRGIRPMASVLTRAIGRRGDKDVILVDKSGNVIKH